MTCGPNQEYTTRAECPKNCLFPKGVPSCGPLSPTEGCYCKGYSIKFHNEYHNWYLNYNYNFILNY